MVIEDAAFHPQGRTLHLLARGRVEEDHDPPGPFFHPRPHVGAAPYALGQLGLRLVLQHAAAVEVHLRAPPRRRHDRHDPVVAREVGRQVPGVVAGPRHVLRDHAQAARGEGGGDEGAAVRPAAAEREVELQPQPPRLVHRVPDRREPLGAVVRQVPQALRRIVHGDRVDGLDLRAPEPRLLHEGQLPGDLGRGDGAAEPPPARHRLRRGGRIGERPAEGREARGDRRRFAAGPTTKGPAIRRSRPRGRRFVPGSRAG